MCDYHLGNGEDGTDVIRAIRERTGILLPAILVTGDTSSRVTETVSRIDACHLLRKPVDADALLELTARLLREAEQPPAPG